MSPQQQKHKIEMEIIDKGKSSKSEKDKSNMASSNTLQNPTPQNEIISAANPIAPQAPPSPPIRQKRNVKYVLIHTTNPHASELHVHRVVSRHVANATKRLYWIRRIISQTV